MRASFVALWKMNGDARSAGTMKARSPAQFRGELRDHDVRSITRAHTVAGSAARNSEANRLLCEQEKSHGDATQPQKSPASFSQRALVFWTSSKPGEDRERSHGEAIAWLNRQARRNGHSEELSTDKKQKWFKTPVLSVMGNRKKEQLCDNGDLSQSEKICIPRAGRRCSGRWQSQ